MAREFYGGSKLSQWFGRSQTGGSSLIAKQSRPGRAIDREPSRSQSHSVLVATTRGRHLPTDPQRRHDFQRFPPLDSRIYRMAGPHLTAYVLSQALLALQAEDATAVETRQPPAVMMLEGAPRCRTPAPRVGLIAIRIPPACPPALPAQAPTPDPQTSPAVGGTSPR
jgi:hypothetical protein